jgi:hypothetical protein
VEEIKVFQARHYYSSFFAKLLESMVVRFLWKCRLILENVLLGCSPKAWNSLMNKTSSTSKMLVKELNSC